MAVLREPSNNRDYPLRGKGERHNLPVLTRAEG